MTVSLFLLLITTFVMVFAFRNVFSEEVDGDQLLKNARIISIRLKAVNNFVWGVFIFTLALLLSTNYKDWENRNFALIAIALLLIIFTYTIKSELRFKIKRPLNSKYRGNFPLLRVITEEGEYNGRLEDIFDKGALKLRNEFGITVIPWNTVKVILINENIVLERALMRSGDKNRQINA